MAFVTVPALASGSSAFLSESGIWIGGVAGNPRMIIVVFLIFRASGNIHIGFNVSRVSIPFIGNLDAEPFGFVEYPVEEPFE